MTDPIRRRGDALLGAVVLAGIVGLVVLAGRLDGPIRAPIAIEAAVQEAAGDASGSSLPVGDFPCAGTQVGPHLVCSDDFALRTDLPLGFELRPLYHADGPILAGGPIAPDRGVLVYELAGELRYTTSDKTAERVADAARDPRLFFGYDRLP